MFNFKSFILIVCLMCSGMLANAQDNIVKAGLSGAFLGDINFGFEKMMSDNSSLHFKIGYLDPLLSPLIPEKAFTPKAYNLLEGKGGISTSLEYRFYVSNKRGLQGFYIAPYLRYFNQDMLFDDEIEGYIFTVDTKINTFGLGGQLGYQWIFNEIFALDLFFFGTGLDFYKGEIKYELSPEPPGFNYGMVTPHVDDVFKDIGFLYKKLEHEVNPGNHTSKLPFIFPGFRMGISVGIAF
jgi:hypothetical protein